MAMLLYRLGHFSVRRRRLVAALWLLALVGAAGASAGLGGQTTNAFTLPGTESQEAFDLLDERFPTQGGTFTRVVVAGPSLEDPAVDEAVAAAFEQAGEVPGVSLATPPLPTATSADGRIAFGEVRYPVGPFDVEEETSDAVGQAFAGLDDQGVRVEFGGEVVPGRVTEPPSSEAIGLLFAVVILLITFGSVLAMGLPIITALIGLGIGISGIGIASSFADVSDVTPTLAVMIGLAVGIDYALFIVTRHRQNIGQGMDVEESVARANATAGSAVVFAGMTVVIAVAGLAVVGIPFLSLMGFAAAGTVAVAVLVAVSLLPALLGFVGENIDRFRPPGLANRTGGTHEGETIGTRWAAWVTHHRVASLVAAVVVMGVLAAPVVSMRLGFPDQGSDPPDTTQRQAYDLLVEGFGPGFNAPLTVVADLSGTDRAEQAVADVVGALEGTEGIQSVREPTFNEAGDTVVIIAVPTEGPTEEATTELIHHVRDDVLGPLEADGDLRLAVSGTTAAGIDISEKLGNALPVFMILVIGLIFLLLLVVFRSILIPIKAALAILLSIGSSFGVIVAMFQWGWLKDVIGLEETLPIVSFLPMMMFAILFGLSMDYELFILSRVREEYVHNGDPQRAVHEGLANSARVITAAALIMVSVFGAFVLGDEPAIKMFGIGLSAAVLLDATIVRMVIVPSVLSLFDEKAWWLPRWLDRLLPNLDIEGERLIAHLAEQSAAPAADTSTPAPAGAPRP